MNLALINWAERYYQLIGYKKITVPWLVPPAISDLTKPVKRRNFLIDEEALVGSAEQGYLSLMAKDKLPLGRYVTTTPCFRDEEVLDKWHRKYFLKTELIETREVGRKALARMLEEALGFFQQFVKVKTIETGEDTYDIIEARGGIELGSYGIGKATVENKKLDWVFGTGCAEPRLSLSIARQKKKGYHSDLNIPKNKVGTPLKIFEELWELEDAVLADGKMLILCELADLMGAVRHYLKENFPGIELTDLRKMAGLTRRAFRNGMR